MPTKNIFKGKAAWLSKINNREVLYLRIESPKGYASLWIKIAEIAKTKHKVSPRYSIQFYDEDSIYTRDNWIKEKKFETMAEAKAWIAKTFFKRPAKKKKIKAKKPWILLDTLEDLIV